MSLSPAAPNYLRYGLEQFSTRGLTRKFEHQPMCIWTTRHLKPNGSEQPTALAECQLPISGQFMNIKSRTLDIA